MSDRLADVEARIGTLRQLEQVVGAIRAIAAARGRAAQTRLEAVRAHAAIVARAIGRALALPGSAETASAIVGHDGRAIVVFSAEQGFAGAYGAAVLERAAALVGAGPPARLLLIGDRGAMLAAERGMAIAWSTPMILHDDQATALAGRVVDEVWRRVAAREITRVDLVHARPEAAGGGVAVRSLLPFDFARFPPDASRPAPLVQLPREVLTARLVEEWVFAEVCEAAILAFVAETEARVRAMTDAREKIGETLEETRGRARRLRQEAITDEIVELAGGSLAATDVGPGV